VLNVWTKIRNVTFFADVAALIFVSNASCGNTDLTVKQTLSKHNQLTHSNSFLHKSSTIFVTASTYLFRAST
jgi:hypothetical protein